jgi:hypothetical protein
VVAKEATLGWWIHKNIHRSFITKATPALCLVEFPLGSLRKMLSIYSMGHILRNTSSRSILAFLVPGLVLALLYLRGDLGHDHYHPHRTTASRLLPLPLPIAAMGSTSLIWNTVEWSQFRNVCLDFTHHPPTMEMCLRMMLWRTPERLAIHQWEEVGDFLISAGTYPSVEDLAVLILTMLPKLREVVM